MQCTVYEGRLLATHKKIWSANIEMTFSKVITTWKVARSPPKNSQLADPNLTQTIGPLIAIKHDARADFITRETTQAPNLI